MKGEQKDQREAEIVLGVQRRVQWKVRWQGEVGHWVMMGEKEGTRWSEGTVEHPQNPITLQTHPVSEAQRLLQISVC